MALEYDITLDMDKSDRSPEMVAARAGDHDSVKVNASLTYNGEAYTPQGTNAYFECITSAGTSVRIPATLSGTSVSVLIPMAALVAPGVVTCAYFRFESGDADEPTVVESTQSFGIIIPDSIDGNVDASDYISEWRGLQQQLEGYVSEVSKEAEDAKEHFEEQSTEIDTLKAQAQKEIATHVTEVESAKDSATSSISADLSAVDTAKTQAVSSINDAKDSAISSINDAKQEVADAAQSITEAGDEAIAQFTKDWQSAISSFNTDGAEAIEQLGTKGDSAISQFNTNGQQAIDKVSSDGAAAVSSVQDDMDELSQSVQTNINELDEATQKAIDAMESALSEDQYGELVTKLSRVWKLDAQDMTAINSGADLNTLASVGSYVCKTDAIAQSLTNKPEDLACSFIMHNMSVDSSSSNLVQLAIPQTYPDALSTVAFYIRKRTSTGTFSDWKKVGGGADIKAGAGIIVSGDGEKEVSIDSDAFHEEFDNVKSVSADTSVTGGASISKLIVHGKSAQNLWVNPPDKTVNGITATENEDGSINVSGTSSSPTAIRAYSYNVRPGTEYTVSVDKAIASVATDGCFSVYEYNSEDEVTVHDFGFGSTTSLTFTAKSDTVMIACLLYVAVGKSVSGTYKVMLNEGSEAKPWVKPGINYIIDLKLVCTGKNLMKKSGWSEGTIDITSGVEYINGVEVKSDYIRVVPGEYTLSTNVVSKLAKGRLYDSVKNYIGGFDTGMTSLSPDTVAFDDGVAYIRIIMTDTDDFSSTSSLKDGVLQGVDIQLEAGYVATAYETPQIYEVPIDLSGYGVASLSDGTEDYVEVDADGSTKIVLCTGDKHISAEEWTLYAESYNTSGDDLYYCALDVKGVKERVDAIVCDKYYTTDNITTGQPLNSIRLAYGNDTNGAERVYVVVKHGQKPEDCYILYTAASNTKVTLPSVKLPAIKSSVFNACLVTNDIGEQVEFDMSLDKVGYAGSSVDAYTKEEVDSMLSGKEDAFEVLPVSSGGTGVTTAAAERNRLGLGNTTGALPIANGGTGKTTARAANAALFSDMQVIDSDIVDDSNIVVKYPTPDDTNGALHIRKATSLWNYIKSKVTSAFGFNSSGVLSVSNGGTGATTAEQAKANLGISDDQLDLASDVKDALEALTVNPVINVDLTSTRESEVLNDSVKPGVSGKLPLSNGGTGGDSASAAQYNILGNSMQALMTFQMIEDDTRIPIVRTDKTVTNGALGTHTASELFDYIADKVADRVWDKIKSKSIDASSEIGDTLTLTGGMQSMSRTVLSSLELSVAGMSFENSNMAPLEVNGSEVVTADTIDQFLPAGVDARSVWFDTPLENGSMYNLITSYGFSLEEMRKYFRSGNIVLIYATVKDKSTAVTYELVFPSVIRPGDAMIMMSNGGAYAAITKVHLQMSVAFAYDAKMTAGLDDGTVMLFTVDGDDGNYSTGSKVNGFVVFNLQG